MRKGKINFNKSFDQQHCPIIANVIRSVVTSLISLLIKQIQKQYPEYAEVEWVNEITDLIADIIRNKRRSDFRRERVQNPDASKRKRERPRSLGVQNQAHSTVTTAKQFRN